MSSMTTDIPNPTKTARHRATQGLRSVASKRTVAPAQATHLRELSRFLQDPQANIPLIIQSIERVLSAYEFEHPFHVNSGDVPLGLRRVIRLLTGEQRK